MKNLVLCSILILFVNQAKAQNAYVDTIYQMPFAFTSEHKLTKNDSKYIEFICDSIKDVGRIATYLTYTYKEKYGSDILNVGIALKEIDNRWSYHEEVPLIMEYFSCIRMNIAVDTIINLDNLGSFLFQGKNSDFSYVVKVFRDYEQYSSPGGLEGSDSSGLFRETCVFVVVEYKGELYKSAKHIVDSFSHKSNSY